MDLTPEERAKFEADWKKANAAGAALGRQRAVATIVSSAVFALIGFLLVGRLGFLLGIPLTLIAGVPAGMAVRRKFWPRGQFQ